jgi:hypothetical protein
MILVCGRRLRLSWRKEQFGANIQLKYAVPDESKNVAFYSKKINCNGDLLTPLI